MVVNECLLCARHHSCKLYIHVPQSPICGGYYHFAQFKDGDTEIQKVK